MGKELVISHNRHETKVAVLEDDQLVELSFQRANEYSLAGSIHKGRVTRVLPGMQSAFVDLGLERDTFLYVTDFFEEHPDVDTVSEEREPRGGRGEQRRDRGAGRDRERTVEAAKPIVVEERHAAVEAPPEASAAAPPGATAEGQGQQDGQGDRRGRRSRRKRSRGRGFPESKYAQPSREEAQTGSTEETEADGAEEADEVAEVSADVVLLPGESLKKYRNAPVHETVAAKGSQGKQALREDALDDDVDDEAREIPPAEAIPEFSDDPEEPRAGSHSSHAATHEATAHAAHPAEHASAAENRHSEEQGGFSIHHTGEIEGHGLSPVVPAGVPFWRRDAEPNQEVSNQEEPAEGSIEFSGIQVESEASVLELPEEEVEGIEQALDEIRQEKVLEDAGAEEVDEAEASEQPSAPADMQSASVREQGRNLQHRVSRRMRRRGRGRFDRGGNGGTEAGSTGSGAVPAPTTEARQDEVKQARDERSDQALPSITELLKAGQEIIVQIAKEPLGQKGARITSHVALPGRFVVFMPSVEHLGVSRKIASDEERYRLKKILQAHRSGTSGGFIVRTAGEGRTEDEIAADMNFLYNLWLDIRQKAEKKPAPLLLHHDLDVVQRILRDQLTDDYKAIWVDSEEMYESVVRFVQRFQPPLVSRVKMYTRSAPIFDAFNITQELEKALRPKVWLKSGGYIVINQTEALVAIDVNTGKFVGKSNRLEDTIVKINTEAIKEIVRQIRLRDLGGIIVVDFIDMDERKNRQKVMQVLEEAMRADKAPYKILQFNDFGLVAITRKRVKQSLERTLCAPCPYCEGAGSVKSVQTVIGEILIEAQKIARALEGKDVMLRCNPDVAKVLKSKSNQYLEELEEILSRPVLVTGDPQIHLEKFDLA
jgi:ribonuclease G